MAHILSKIKSCCFTVTLMQIVGDKENEKPFRLEPVVELTSCKYATNRATNFGPWAQTEGRLALNAI